MARLGGGQAQPHRGRAVPCACVGGCAIGCGGTAGGGRLCPHPCGGGGGGCQLALPGCSGGRGLPEVGGARVQNLLPDHLALCYKGVLEQLSMRDGPDGLSLLILDRAWIVVPCRAQRRILELLHRPHTGDIKTQQAARQPYYWPGMSAAISDADDDADTRLRRGVNCVRTPCPTSRWRRRWTPLCPPGPCRRWGSTCSTLVAGTTS